MQYGWAHITSPDGRSSAVETIFRSTIAAMLALAVVLFVTAAHAAPPDETAQAPPELPQKVVEDEYNYEAVKGDTLSKIAGRFGVELDYLVRHNPQKDKFVRVGDKFNIKKRTIVPAGTDEGIVINIPDRTLYLFKGGELASRYPVGLGKPSWRTPRGSFRVIEKIKDPTWHVPPSIQREMAEQGLEVKTEVPPGPDNPLGRWALRTSIPGVMIHETNAPSSVYLFRSHGCIRMRGDDVSRLFESVSRGDTGEITYETVKLARTPSGEVYLEVYKDAYGLAKDPLETAFERIEAHGLSGQVDWDKVIEVVKGREGIAYSVTRKREGRVYGQKEFSESRTGAGDIAFPHGSAVERARGQ